MTTTLTGFLRLQVPLVSVPNVARKFHHDQMALIGYLERVYGHERATGVLNGKVIATDYPVVSEVLLFPVRADMDPREEETAQWAVFACERTLYDEDSGTYKTRTRFPDPDDIFLLLDAEVPLAYASSITTPWGEYPTESVIAAWRENMPIEYLSVALGS